MSLYARPALIESDKERQPGKTYPRMPHIRLSIPTTLELRLTDALAKRHSGREFSLQHPLSLSELGLLLGHSLGAGMGNRYRTYGSGGGLYPLEAYVIAHNVDGLNDSVYHYAPDTHELERLWNLPPDESITSLMPSAPWAAFASCIIVLTCVWERSRKKYSDFAYLLSLVESGGAGQNVALVAQALGIDACLVAGFSERGMEKILDLSPDEQPLYCIVVGKNN